ncbi:Retinoblastoma 1, partial [Brachionus plicatilis]
MEIEQTEDKDNENKLNVQFRKKITELVEYLGLKDVNLIYENFVDSESRNSIENICLNLIDETWTNFEHLKNIFSIENEEEHWLGCCLYLAYEKISYIVRKKMEVENQNNQNQLSNKKNPTDKLDSEIISKIDSFPFFSILKLLRQLKIDLSKFLKLTNKLIEILKVPAHLSTRLIKIESNFNVARVLFEKYETIFKNVFNYSYEFLINFFATDQHTIDTHSKVNSKHFFTFGWLLFINIKNQFPHISNDLVNSYHLLICCINYLYQRIENLNQQYLLDISICRKNGLKSLKFNKFIDYICKKYDGNSIEIKTVNEYYFQPQIKNLLSDKCESMEFLHILCTKLDKNYEKILLNRNNCANTELSFNLDIDERVLLKKLVHHSEKMAIDQEEKALFSIKVSDSLQTIYDLDNHEHESKPHNHKFEFQKNLDLFKTLFINDVIKNFNESGLDDLAHVKENVIYLLNEFFAIVYNFYLLSIDILISNEKKRLGLDCFLK